MLIRSTLTDEIASGPVPICAGETPGNWAIGKRTVKIPR
jgi:hypothetical protein